MVRPLDYNSGINLEEAKERLKEVREAFAGVQKHYSGFWSRFKWNLNAEDNKTLADCVGVLLPLSQEQAVQEEFKRIATDPDNDLNQTLSYQSGILSTLIIAYTARFRNTGVKILPGVDFS